MPVAKCKSNRADPILRIETDKPKLYVQPHHPTSSPSLATQPLRQTYSICPSRLVRLAPKDCGQRVLG